MRLRGMAVWENAPLQEVKEYFDCFKAGVNSPAHKHCKITGIITCEMQEKMHSSEEGGFPPYCTNGTFQKIIACMFGEYTLLLFTDGKSKLKFRVGLVKIQLSNF